jgi:hypothetical protein
MTYIGYHATGKNGSVLQVIDNATNTLIVNYDSVVNTKDIPLIQQWFTKRYNIEWKYEPLIGDLTDDEMDIYVGPL